MDTITSNLEVSNSVSHLQSLVEGHYSSTDGREHLSRWQIQIITWYSMGFHQRIIAHKMKTTRRHIELKLEQARFAMQCVTTTELVAKCIRLKIIR